MIRPPNSIQLPSSMLIDPKKEPLKEILPFYRGITHVPSEIDGPALMVFIELQKCFDKAGRVCEGLLGNLIWGLQEVGYDAKHIAAGLTQLREKEFIFYSDESGNRISSLILDPTSKIMWLRYGKKFLDVIVKGEVGDTRLLKEGVKR